jgi:hypothetical protein
LDLKTFKNGEWRSYEGGAEPTLSCSLPPPPDRCCWASHSRTRISRQRPGISRPTLLSKLLASRIGNSSSGGTNFLGARSSPRLDSSTRNSISGQLNL